MKIIFTDIDGVLNKNYYNKENGGLISSALEKNVKVLKTIVEATNSVVVLISRANSLLGKGFDKERIDEIENYGVKIYDSIKDIEYQESKAYPIRRWLKRNDLVSANYVVIDDCASNLGQEFGNRFIHIKGKSGLTQKYAQQIIDLLND